MMNEKLPQVENLTLADAQELGYFDANVDERRERNQSMGPESEAQHTCRLFMRQTGWDRECPACVRSMPSPADIRKLEDEAFEQGREAARQEFAELLPGPYYMDPPDGGNVTIRLQFKRMAADAARYRWLVEKTHGVLPMARVQIMRQGQYVLHVGRDIDNAIAKALVSK